jgi:hypothetical protein
MSQETCEMATGTIKNIVESNGGVATDQEESTCCSLSLSTGNLADAGILCFDKAHYAPYFINKLPRKLSRSHYEFSLAFASHNAGVLPANP